jgi:hypothetical protein
VVLFALLLGGCGEIYDAVGTLAVAGGLPAPIGKASSELSLVRTGPDRSDDVVHLAMSESEAQLSAAVAGPWVGELDVRFAADASNSSLFYVRGAPGGPAALALTSRRLGQRTATIDVSSLILAEDFEGGDFSIRDKTKWDDPVVQVPAKVGLTVNPQGAHRGGGGLYLDDRDASGGVAEMAEVARLSAVFRPFQDHQFVRAWVKVSPTSIVGEAIPLTMWQGGKEAFYELNLRLPSGTIEPAGYAANGEYLRDESSPPLADGRWHLWETAVLRLGSPSAERSFWLDGQLVSKRTGLQSSTMHFTHDSFGLPWSNDTRFTGVIAFDDVRIGVSAHPSRLAVSLAASAGACAKLTVALHDSMSASPAQAPYDVDVELSGAPDGAFLDSAFVDAACVKQARALTIVEGSTSSFVFVRRTAALRLSARHPDFLPSPEVDVPASTTGCTHAPSQGLAAALFLWLALVRRRAARSAS